MRSWRSWAPSPRKCSRTQPALRLGPASVRANESASKRRSGCGRAGNAVLRATLTECALGAARTRASQFHGYHDKIKARIGHKRATLATAHKLLRVIYAILRDDHPYRAPNVNYESLFVRPDASRWLRMLSKYNYLDEARAAA